MPAEIKLDLNILPQKVDKKVTVKLKNNVDISIDQFPVINLEVILPHNYPSINLPQIKIKNKFYNHFVWTMLHKGLYQQFQDRVEEQVIYEMFEYCKDSLITDAFKLDINSIIEVPMFTKEQFFDE